MQPFVLSSCLPFIVSSCSSIHLEIWVPTVNFPCSLPSIPLSPAAAAAGPTLPPIVRTAKVAAFNPRDPASVRQTNRAPWSKQAIVSPTNYDYGYGGVTSRTYARRRQEQRQPGRVCELSLWLNEPVEGSARWGGRRKEGRTTSGA
jgi:hypothetical protein